MAMRSDGWMEESEGGRGKNKKRGKDTDRDRWKSVGWWRNRGMDGRRKEESCMYGWVDVLMSR